VTGDRRLRTLGLAGLLAAVIVLVRPATPDAAARLDVQAELDRRQIAVGETATLTVTVTAEGVEVPAVLPPAIPKLQMDRLGASQGFSWINGRVTRTSTIAFRLRPAAEGDYTIPAIHVSGGGVSAESTPITLQVGKALAPARAGTSELFARMVVDRSRVYWNEGIVARFTVYSRVRLEGIQSWDPPDAAGFWTEVMGQPRSGRVVIDGVQYDANELRVTYFPTRTGRLTLGPGRVHLRVVRQVSQPDPWSQLGLPDEEIEDVTLVTGTSAVNVIPLPAGAPPSFKGAVGDFSMDVKVDRLSVHAGEPVTVTTTVKGEGNVASAGDPDASASAPARTYVGGATTTINRSGERLRGERRRDVTLIPESPGRMAILPVRFSWFDPEANRYRTQVSDSIRVTVQIPGAGSDSSHAARALGPVAALRSKPGHVGRLTLEPPPAGGAIAIASLLAYGLALAGQRLRRRAERDPRRRRALALAALASELHHARKGKSPADAAARFGEILRQAVGIRYGIDVDGLPALEVLVKARAAGAKEGDLEEVKELLASLDRLAFAPRESLKGDGREERKAVEKLLRRYREAFE
jgi:oxygen tolerance protein BatD